MPKIAEDKQPDPIDIHVGQRIRMRRMLLPGMSQEKLANLLGITFQQVQKYENGKNRVSASRLYRIGKILLVPVSFFYEGMSLDEEGNYRSDPESLRGYKNKMTHKVAAAFDEIEDPHICNAIRIMVERSGPKHCKIVQQSLEM